MTTWLALLLAYLPFQVGEGVLRVGETIEAEIEGDERLVHTETLDEHYTDTPTVGRSFVLEVDEPGPYTIDLRSYFFDAYLVVRDAEGNVLAEDDDGLIEVHARLIVELRAGETYRVDACALHGRRGRFELALRSGAASLDGLSVRERAILEREEAERRVRTLEEALGPDHPRTAQSLNSLGELLRSQGDHAGARPLLERALAIREKALGPEHPTTATSLNNLAGLLLAQGDHAGARPLYERALAIAEKVLGPEHPDVASSLNNLGLLLESQGDYAGARPLHERALAIRERVLGPEHPDVAQSLGSLAWLLRAQGDYASARPLCERALAIQEKALGPEHPTTAASLNNLAALLWSQGDYAGARPLLERALAIREKVLGLEHPDTAMSLNNLAALLRAQGDYAGARPLLERALAITESVLGPEHPSTARSLNNLAALLWSQGDYAGARPLHERALAILESVLGPEHPEVATSLNNLAGLLADQGDYAGARPLHERALAILEKVLGPEHPGTAESLNSLAVLLHSQGDYAGARPHFERALAINEKALGPEHPTTATSLNNLAGLLDFQGDLAGARPFYERALAIREKALGPEHPDVAQILNNLAGLLRDQGDYAGARPLLERAHAIAESVLGPDHPRTAKSLNNLGELLRSQGDYAGARPLLERALAMTESVLGPEHSEVAASLNNLALLLASQGDYSGARPLLERALAIHESALGPEHPHVAQSLNNLALLLFDSGEADAAWGLLSRAARGRSGHLHGVLQGLSEAESYRYLSKLRSQLEVQLSVGSALEETGAATQSYRGMIEWKGRIARALVASREQLTRELDEEQSTLVGELRSAQTRLSRLLSEEPPGSAVERANHRSSLGDLREERNALELALKRSLEAEDPEPIPTVSELAAALPSQSAVVDLFVHGLYEPARLEGGELVRAGSWSEDRVFAWIVRAGEPDVTRVDLGVADRIEADVRDFLEDLVVRRGMKIDESNGSEDDANAALRASLWAPLQEHLADVETVFVSPDSFLGTLPLETLALEDGSFLLEHHGFVYVQDVASLAYREEEPTDDYGSLLAMGGVDFRKRADWDGAELLEAGATERGSFAEYWGRLPATEYESQVVSDLHEDAFGDENGRLLLQGAEPTEERLKHELSRHVVLHLATHGFFQPEGTPSMWESALNERGQQEMRMSDEASQLVGKHPGLLSGLVCAGANRPPEGEGDDGYLTAEEVGWLDLTDVELVVMSACETGLGRAESGEGLIGLRRAFRTAGAKTVISSLWSVKDDSTAELMRDFYVNLWMKGMGRLEALRSAQLAMLRKNRMEHGRALPSTWGAFVLSGEWR